MSNLGADFRVAYYWKSCVQGRRSLVEFTSRWPNIHKGIESCRVPTCCTLSPRHHHDPRDADELQNPERI